MFDVIGQWMNAYPEGPLRIMSAIGVMLHWGILQYVLGLPFMAFIALLIHVIRGDGVWERIARTLTKGFIIVFAVGAASGTLAEFGLVLIWPNLTHAAGRYIFFPLYAEIFAFLMEVVFIYLLWYGWRRLPVKARLVVALLAFIGAWYSASMIISVNSYMVAPTGIVPAYDPYTGVFRYAEGYPKIAVVVPSSIARLLDVDKLRAVGAEIVGETGEGVVVLLPVKIVQRVVYEAYSGVALKDSVLRAVLKPPEQLAFAAGGEDALSKLLSTPVSDVLDAILVATVKHVGVTMVTFLSPVFVPSILHTLGAAITVSAFTAMAGFALRLLKPASSSTEYRRYVETGFKFTATVALVAIIVQGLVFGHMLGKAIAYYNPEKFAAMEGTSSRILSISRLLGIDRIMPLIAYEDLNAKLPDYDSIPADWCQLSIAPNPAIKDCRPPLIIHYFYYAKIGLSILLGIYAAIIGIYMLARKIPPLSMPRWILLIAPIAAFTSQVVSNLGWFVREVGRKPWTVYGVMTVDVAATINPPSPGVIALLGIYWLAIAMALVYAAWRALWTPGKEYE